MTEDLAYLRTPAAIRERAEKMLTYVEDGKSSWFALDGNGLEAAVQATLEVTRKRFPNPSDIPFHSRWRQFEAGGRDRWAALAERLAGLPKERRKRGIVNRIEDRHAALQKTSRDQRFPGDRPHPDGRGVHDDVRAQAHDML